MTADRAETIALTAFAWLLAQDELRGVFLGATGASPEDLRAAASDPATLTGVLDFLAMNDAWLIDFCRDEGVGPEEPMTARAVLAGPAETHWT